MHTLRIEHTTNSFEAWKRAFDSDPAGRKSKGVRRYRILRATDDPGWVMIDLEFETAAEAETMHAALRGMWRTLDASIISNPQTRIAEIVETKEI